MQTMQNIRILEREAKTLCVKYDFVFGVYNNVIAVYFVPIYTYFFSVKKVGQWQFL